MKGDHRSRFDAPGDDDEQARIDFTFARGPAASEAEAIKRRHEPDLLRIAGVEGVGIGNSDGVEEIVLYLSSPDVRSRVPRSLEQVPVRTVITGSIDALPASDEI